MKPPHPPGDTAVILGAMSQDAASPEDSLCLALGALIQRMSAGDEAALGQLYDLTLSRVYGLAMKITGRRELAEEICVETFWQSWREASRYDARRGQPLAWLMVMTRTRALDALRRLDRAASTPEPETNLENDAAPEASPLDHLLHSERTGALRAALTALTPIQRQLVALAFYKDLSHQQISHQTGLPLGTVKSHLKRAQHSLRTLLCPA